jgi:excinuclease ABC subunit A
MEKPDVDFIEGAFAGDRHRTTQFGTNPRSIIATTTEIYDYSARPFFGGRPAARSADGAADLSPNPQQIVDQILDYPAETKIILLAPLVRNESGRIPLM